ncbi:GtrA family protein [Vibrio parahaemolyticus]|uniref:GtrA family protein n=1 Tax=Vibrio parahaemolyticus TaxID=670 RepID=UPI00046E9D84|nr:GtrA family protein [Vibrio parahaemolyticus]EGQ9466339.1 GtrA family protein [Vibrio parahaemolyticus]EJB0383865.1 GtrA family protein [Vibrio parahaemolyticus]EJG1102390.1 GtrA family protein [Vibrio parahaemolyticus]EJG1627680.1 GtrA family protein [Vibrio parahaemolyticus]ELA6664727.1 GtrA family protein [Vibrio parahaemolyticus]
MKLVILYILFAILATIANLTAQEIAYQLYHGFYRLAHSMFWGTLIGLVVKYVLDKRYIFNFEVKSHSQDFKTFVMYSAMGVITTLVFWASEWMFDYWFETKQMRYIGAILGLSIGYITKYYLDKKFVFVRC